MTKRGGLEATPFFVLFGGKIRFSLAARSYTAPVLGRISLLIYNPVGQPKKRRLALEKKSLLIMISCFQAFLTTPLFAQAFGEYSRAVGGVPQGVGPRAPGSAPQGGSGSDNVGDLGGKALPSHLVVAAKGAALYPKQDDESEKLAQLAQGEILVPMVQSNGGNDWFMVKTQKGVIGWVKYTDVREDKAKK